MKLDESVVSAAVEAEARGWEHLVDFLENLDLVFKSGDSSQSILVENKPPKNLTISWSDVYAKDK